MLLYSLSLLANQSASAQMPSLFLWEKQPAPRKAAHLCLKSSFFYPARSKDPVSTAPVKTKGKKTKRIYKEW